MNDDIQWREEIEWQNIWWEQATDAKQKRIALLGDSVTRGYRSKLNDRLGGKYVVDICASSSQITNSLLWKEYKFFFECNTWEYNKIFLQAGGQHGHIRKCCTDVEYCKLFKEEYIKLVRAVRQFCQNIFIVSFTPNVEKDDLSKWNVSRNAELEKRNQLVQETAKILSVPYIDIWNPLLETRFEYKDYIHIEDKGNEFIAEYLQQFC